MVQDNTSKNTEAIIMFHVIFLPIFRCSYDIQSPDIDKTK